MLRPYLVLRSPIRHQQSDRLTSPLLFVKTHQDARFFRWVFGHIGDPKLIESRCGEVAICEVTDGANSNQVVPSSATFGELMKVQFLRYRSLEFVIHDQNRLNPQRCSDSAIPVSTPRVNMNFADSIR
jgi:hypothetical protein